MRCFRHPFHRFNPMSSHIWHILVFAYHTTCPACLPALGRVFRLAACVFVTVHRQCPARCFFERSAAEVTENPRIAARNGVFCRFCASRSVLLGTECTVTCFPAVGAAFSQPSRRRLSHAGIPPPRPTPVPVHKRAAFCIPVRVSPDRPHKADGPARDLHWRGLRPWPIINYHNVAFSA